MTSGLQRGQSAAKAENGQGGAVGERPSLPSAYRAADVEPGIYERWLAADVFAPDGAGSRADASRPPFVIIMPPPNVTGALHLGHAARATIEDSLIRQARMTGRPTLFLPGKDHASIAAQVVLDRALAKEGESRASLGRDRYLERMWRFVEETRPVISGQLRRIGVSADWSRERFTVDEVSARAVRVSFKRLYDADLIYRAEALINWCPGCRTSLSDLEVVGKPEQGRLWTVRYHLADAEGRPEPDAWISVATTRPETILGDVAVAVNPDDERYRNLVGRNAVIPFVERIVQIIADAVVEPGFGTGAVKITPAHDHTDHETAKRHGLPAISVLADDGTINEHGAAYAGLDRFVARQRILDDLETRGDLASSVAHELTIGRCERSDDIVEPMLKVQWFARATQLAPAAMAAVREGRTRIVPRRFEKVFFHWMENIHDWNISRQLWWGHRIPAWYCADGHITVSEEEAGPDACAACGRPAVELRQEEDILDTWYSSGLWPFSTLGWPEPTDDLARYYPGTVMETAYDILFFWVARMMMLGEALTSRTPFETVLLAGLVRDPHGRKLSKTKGIVADPLEIMDELGADVLRYALVDGSSPGNDQRLGRARIEGARNFANKLWNAARFVLASRPPEIDIDADLALPASQLIGPADHWILSRLSDTVAGMDRAFTEMRLGEAARIINEGIWGDYCDWYLELVKVRLSVGAPLEQRVAAWQVLALALERYLRLLHPLMPFITEAIWQELPRSARGAQLLIVAPWPGASAGSDEPLSFDADRAAATASLLQLVRAIRNARVEAAIGAGEWLEADLYLADQQSRAVYEATAAELGRLARVRPVRVHADRAALGSTAAGTQVTVLSGDHEARLARGAAGVAGEGERLQRELEESQRLLSAARGRLADQGFVSRAPAAIVEGARSRAAELEERVERLASRLGELKG